MGEYDRGLASGDGVHTGLVGGVAEVDDHPQPVHLLDHCATERGQTIVHRAAAMRLIGVRTVGPSQGGNNQSFRILKSEQ